MTNIVQKALEEAVTTRNREIDELKCKLKEARSALYSGILFINNFCREIDGQDEMYDYLNKVYIESQ